MTARHASLGAPATQRVLQSKHLIRHADKPEHLKHRVMHTQKAARMTNA